MHLNQRQSGDGWLNFAILQAAHPHSKRTRPFMRRCVRGKLAFIIAFTAL